MFLDTSKIKSFELNRSKDGARDIGSNNVPTLMYEARRSLELFRLQGKNAHEREEPEEEGKNKGEDDK